MKVIESDNYQISIGDKSLTAFGFTDYSALAILVDENTKKHCLPIFLGENLYYQYPLSYNQMYYYLYIHNETLKLCLRLKLWYF